MKQALFIAIMLLKLAGQVYAQEKEHNFTVIPEKINCDSILLSDTDTVRVISVINNSSFRVEQSFRLTKKQGLTIASYYSCDGKTGYLIFNPKSSIEIYCKA